MTVREMNRLLTGEQKTQCCAYIARKHTNWSIGQIYNLLEFKPVSCARAFKIGTAARANEERSYALRMIHWELVAKLPANPRLR